MSIRKARNSGASQLSICVAATSLLLISAWPARGADEATEKPQPAQASNEELLKKLDAMEKRIRMLEGQLKRKEASASAPAGPPPASSPASAAAPASADPAAPTAPAAPATPGAETPAVNKAPAGKGGKASTWAAAATTPEVPGRKPILGLIDSPVPGLSMGAYGEIQYGLMQNPAAGGQWQAGSDAARRFVLLPTYAITENIIFNAEIEFEHAGVAFDNDDKMRGSVGIEQLWIDFKIVDQFNWRAPGIDLVPIGWINQHHEPTEFYSVLRPELYNGLIPSTWRVPGTSIYGTIADGVKYQIMISAAQEDFGDAFDCRTDANTVPKGSGTLPCTQGGPWYFPGVDGLNALSFSSPPLGDFRQLSNSGAISGRLDFTEPASLRGLAWSVSAYYTPNTTPREAHDDFGNPLGKSSLTIFDAEFRYRVPDTPLELRGEGVYVTFGNPASLRANNDSDPTNNVGKSMYGYSGEIAFHLPMGTILSSEWEAVPFYRYTYQNLQTGGFAGTDLNMPTGAGQQQFHNLGIAVFPSPKVVLKATYQKVINNDPAGANSDSFLGGVGFFF